MIYHELYCCYSDGGGSQIAGIAANPNSEILFVFFLLNDTVLETLRSFEFFFIVLRHALLFESLVSQAMLLMDLRSDHIHACRDCMNADCCISLQANVWLRSSTFRLHKLS